MAMALTYDDDTRVAINAAIILSMGTVCGLPRDLFLEQDALPTWHSGAKSIDPTTRIDGFSTNKTVQLLRSEKQKSCRDGFSRKRAKRSSELYFWTAQSLKWPRRAIMRAFNKLLVLLKIVFREMKLRFETRYESVKILIGYVHNRIQKLINWLFESRTLRKITAT